ncbi:uncharacterized protein BJ171DRAFT_528232 [Polychytrium aggregatum]|uniref:uncharacterized protein n=1 Tax=Polychytrium aggregatum TaxID=110093 RepID=UPI0022FDC216|nr:uncharacterized protein BJ171DRAFT_528232 [Polychytrium aggregatum]KAI9193407.1 hypothetical protein BJ171DRAFT_528232 [Polychytrium aggregatum]
MILEYGDVIIDKEDFDLLEEGQWLNDTIIQFYYEYLELQVHKNNPHVEFLRPSIVHLVTNTQDPTSLQSALPKDLAKKNIVFLPINDSDGTTNSISGSHWSLLVFYRPTNSFYYYDSLGRYNLSAAKLTKDKFAPLLVPRLLNKFEQVSHFAQVETPIQVNGYDCGCYTIAITEILADRLTGAITSELTLKPGDLSLFRLKSLLTPVAVAQKRWAIKDMILGLADLARKKSLMARHR